MKRRHHDVIWSLCGGDRGAGPRRLFKLYPVIDDGVFINSSLVLMLGLSGPDDPV